MDNMPNFSSLSNFGNLNLKDIASSLVSAGVVALLTFIGNSTSIFSLDWKQGLSFVVMAMVASLVKALGTTKDGNFGGVLPIK